MKIFRHICGTVYVPQVCLFVFLKSMFWKDFLLGGFSDTGAVPKHKKTVAAMGLTKMHKTVEMPDNAATRGMIQQVQHLVKVEEA